MTSHFNYLPKLLLTVGWLFLLNISLCNSFPTCKQFFSLPGRSWIILSQTGHNIYQGVYP